MNHIEMYEACVTDSGCSFELKTQVKRFHEYELAIAEKLLDELNLFIKLKRADMISLQIINGNYQSK